MKLLYSIAIFLYGGLIKIYSLFNSKAQLFVAGRKNVFPNLEKLNLQSKSVIWIHVASLGEFEQGRPIIEQLRKKYPNHFLLLTFFSPSGYEVRKNYDQVDYISYLPLDTHSNMKRWVELANPELVILVKYEFWLHLIEQVSLRKVPILVVSAIFRENQIFFKSYGRFMLAYLKKITQFFVQDKQSVTLLQQHNIQQVLLSGDTRFDRVFEIAQTAKPLDFVEQFKNNRFTLVAGSTWEICEEYLSRYIHQNQFPIQFIIAPHEIDSQRIAEFREKSGVKSILYSEINNQDLSQYNLLIIDAIGFLTSVYQYADLAYVGGGFGKSGIHNVLEPACFGTPVIYGPNIDKFKEAQDLVTSQGAKIVHDYIELESVVNQFFVNQNEKEFFGKNAQQYVQENTGATKLIIEYIDEVMN